MVAGQAGLEQGVDKLAGRVDSAWARPIDILVPAAVRVLEGEQGPGLAADLAGEADRVDEPPGVQPADPVLQVLSTQVGFALA